MNTSDYFLALDAGGTKTIGALADSERELARAQAGTIKRLRVTSETAQHNLELLLGELTAAAGITPRSIARVCVGTSGASVPLVANWILETLRSLTGAEVVLCGDEEIALDAAFPGGPGILVVAGTGSNVVGRTRAGELVHAGGWGPALADEGSGHWIGHEGLRTAFRALNESRSTVLFERVYQHWRLSGLDDLLEKANGLPTPDFSELTPIIAQAASEGDAVGKEILTRGGEELAHLALLVLEQLRRKEAVPAARVAFTGSVLRHLSMVREAMFAALRHANPEFEIVPEAVDPVAGALWRARSGVPGAGASL